MFICLCLFVKIKEEKKIETKHHITGQNWTIYESKHHITGQDSTIYESNFIGENYFHVRKSKRYYFVFCFVNRRKL